MKRLLIVSPHFPPVNTPDMQRVRMQLPYFRDNGWEVEILCVSPDDIAAPVDPWLVGGLPAHVKIHRVNVIGLRWSWIPGFGALGFRALSALAHRGDELLRNGNFDLVYFSTTVFEVHMLGPRWKRKFGTPFVMDYQDPWVNDYYREHPEIVPPGGRVKYAVINAVHRWMEPRVLRACAGITSVSPDYLRQLAHRYGKHGNMKTLVQPFPGCSADFERVKEQNIDQSLFEPADGNIHWIYVGAVIPGMLPVVHALFASIKKFLPDNVLDRLRLHFIGTSYAAPGTAKPIVLPIAMEYGLDKIVSEQCDRIPYSTTLRCLLDADALLAIGSDDPGYTASKIYPYLLAGKPLLSIYHEASPIVGFIAEVGGVDLVTFPPLIDQEDLANRIGAKWLRQKGYLNRLPVDELKFQEFTDHRTSAVLCRFLAGCIDNE